jgi:hypothetical protein
MLGPNGGRGQHEGDYGLIPKAASELFLQTSRLEDDINKGMGMDTKSFGNRKSNKKMSAFEIRLSFVEIYCNEIFDLLALHPRKKQNPLKIREADGNVSVEGLTEKPITSIKSLLSLLHKGAAQRSTAATGMHADSSRSHAIITLIVEHRWIDPTHQSNHTGGGLNYQCRVSRLSMVDLAGSENMERSHGGRKNLAGSSTNLGLSALSRDFFLSCFEYSYFLDILYLGGLRYIQKDFY